MISPQAASDITVRCNQCFHLAEICSIQPIGACVNCGQPGVTIVATGTTKYTVSLVAAEGIKIPPGFWDDATSAFDAEWEEWDKPEIPTSGNLARYEITLCEEIERDDNDTVSLPIGREPYDEDSGYLHVHGWRIRRSADTQDATHVEEREA